jgi:hypothetical protein
MSSDNQVYTPEAFALEVEKRVISGAEPSYITATSDLIEEMDCDPEEVKHLLSPTLIAKIKAEASKRGLLKEKHLSSDLTNFFAS